jgi:hypothetical protein
VPATAVALQVAQRSVIGGVEKHRSDEQGKRQFRIDLDHRRTRHEGNPDPGQGQQGRIVFFAARLVHALTYIVGVLYVRTAAFYIGLIAIYALISQLF